MADPATLYEEWFVPTVCAPMARQVVAQLTFAPHARLLDVACGNGIVARTIARRASSSATVIGLDINPAMLDVARQKSEAEGLQIAWPLGSA